MPFYTTFSIYPKIYDCSHPPISIIFSNEKLNTSTVPFISYLMPKIVPKTDYDKCQISGSIELHCVGSLGVYASPRAKAVSPYKSKNHRQIHIYTIVQNTKMQDRIPNKKQIEKILEIIYWGAGHPHRSLQNPEYNNTSIAIGTTDPRH